MLVVDVVNSDKTVGFLHLKPSYKKGSVSMPYRKCSQISQKTCLGNDVLCVEWDIK